jgi:hypothetical protein
MSQANHTRLAECFDKAAGDETLPLNQRIEFTKKANWLRILARLATTGAGTCKEPPSELTALAVSLSPDAQLSSFKLNLLLRHYERHAQERQRQTTARAA